MSITKALPRAAREPGPSRLSWSDRLRKAVMAMLPGAQRHQRLPEFDAATLRDLALSHTLAAWTPRDGRGDRRP